MFSIGIDTIFQLYLTWKDIEAGTQLIKNEVSSKIPATNSAKKLLKLSETKHCERADVRNNEHCHCLASLVTLHRGIKMIPIVVEPKETILELRVSDCVPAVIVLG